MYSRTTHQVAAHARSSGILDLSLLNPLPPDAPPPPIGLTTGDSMTVLTVTIDTTEIKTIQQDGTQERNNTEIAEAQHVDSLFEMVETTFSVISAFELAT